MKTTNTLLRILVTTITVVMTSCSGEDGMDGSPGPQGLPGEDGNANVITSDWIPEQFGDDLAIIDSFLIMDDRISQNILDTGVVLAYGRFKGGTNVAMLPNVNFLVQYTVELIPDVGIRFNAFSLSGQGVFFDRFREFRYVIIPSSTSSKNSGLAFSKMSYHEVMNHFGLEY